MTIERLAPDTVSTAVGPWEQAIKVGNVLYISGQTPMSAAGEVVGKGDATAQTRQVMENMKAVCEAGGASLSDVVKTTVFVTNIKDLPAAMAVREEYFSPDFPTATAVEVTALAHPDWLIEIEAIAVIE